MDVLSSSTSAESLVVQAVSGRSVRIHLGQEKYVKVTVFDETAEVVSMWKGVFWGVAYADRWPS